MRSEIREPGGEIGQEVDVEWRSCFAAGDRAEEAQMVEALGLEFGSVAAQDCEDAVGVHFV